MAQAVNSSVALNLPVDLLAGVLQHVQQPDRLRCCTLVSKQWRQAANMTTRTINCTAVTQQSFDSLSAWLNRNPYASKIQSIQVMYKTTAHAGNNTIPVLRVPYTALKQLKILQLLQCQVMIVRPATDAISKSTATAATMAAATTPSTPSEVKSLGALTALSRLELVKTSLDLSELSSCTGLQHLQLYEVDHAGHAGGSVLFHLASALPQLTQLTHFGFRDTVGKKKRKQKQLMANIFASLSSLQHLRELHLSLRSSVQAADVAHIPTNLSSLHLHYEPTWGSSVVPQLQQMTQLQCLCLEGPSRLDPAILFSLTQLTCLSVTQCPFENRESVAAMLRAVQQMKQLRHLDLADSLKDEEYYDEMELYAALTASSQLTLLNITGCSIPPDACPYMFPDGHVSTALISIATYPSVLLNGVSFFRRLVASCPSLQQLVIEESDDEEHFLGVSLYGLSTLQDLSTLTTLAIDGLEFSNHELKVIATFSQLKQLTLSAPHHPCKSVGPAGLMRLTQLTGLTKLKVFAGMEGGGFFEETLVAAGGVPDVLLQLQEAIAKYKQNRIEQISAYHQELFLLSSYCSY